LNTSFFTTVPIVAVLLLIGTDAFAQEQIAAAQSCATVERDSERLACYDSLFRHSAVQSSSAQEPPDPSEHTPVANPQTADQAESDIAAFGIDEMPEKEEKDLKEISARVLKIGKTSSGRQTYHLDNEQVWVKTTERPFTIREGDQITITAGRFGSFSLINTRKARTNVERLR
jgi:hypothetical protein